MEDTPVISLFTSIFYENHKDSIKPDKIGVFSMINFATKEPSIISCTVNTGISAAINSRINKIKYTSKNPKTLPNKVFKVRKIGNLAKDRKSTRLNSSHVSISYAVFRLKQKRNIT